MRRYEWGMWWDFCIERPSKMSDTKVCTCMKWLQVLDKYFFRFKINNFYYFLKYFKIIENCAFLNAQILIVVIPFWFFFEVSVNFFFNHRFVKSIFFSTKTLIFWNRESSTIAAQIINIDEPFIIYIIICDDVKFSIIKFK